MLSDAAWGPCCHSRQMHKSGSSCCKHCADGLAGLTCRSSLRIEVQRRRNETCCGCTQNFAETCSRCTRAMTWSQIVLSICVGPSAD